MGRAFVTHVLSKGGFVSFGDINTALSKSILLQVHSSAPKLVSRLLFTRTDIRDPVQVQDLLQRTKDVFGRVDALFCVAGVNVPDSFLPSCGQSRPSQANLLSIEINLSGTINTIYSALPYLSPNARIVVISSTAGIYPSSVQPTYSASKHGLIAFSRALAPLLTEDKRICVLAPSTYLPPSLVIKHDGSRATPEAIEGDVFGKVIGETLGYIDMSVILKALDEALDHAGNGDVLEITPMGEKLVDAPVVPEQFRVMEARLREQLCSSDQTTDTRAVNVKEEQMET